MKIIEVPVKDCIYFAYNCYKWDDIFITKRWSNKEDYWGYMGEDGNDIKVKFIQ
tara:strand:- start:57 stop:218 length:162 start_codon:yes stop_codon:yes gene_type:complete